MQIKEITNSMGPFPQSGKIQPNRSLKHLKTQPIGAVINIEDKNEVQRT
jgi:hypothetical protein